MRKFGLLGTSAISSAAFVGLSLVLAAPASAQATTEGTPAQQDEDDENEGATADDPNTLGQNEVELESGEAATRNEEITVTGTRIRQPNLQSNIPITSVSAEDLTAQGDVNIGDALNDLPAIRSTYSQANSTRFIGTAGVNLLDLRGLGISRTLVLVNGRRHVTSSPGSFLVDVNTIPTDLIERVDVITGGSSAVYGSDAVAGVVNFVLKRDFEGIRLKGQGGISQQGDRGISFVTLTAGKNLFGDRGNVAINLEYVNAEPLYFTDRPELTGAFNGRCQIQASENPAGEPPTGDGVPDNTFICGVRNATISNGGALSANASVAQCINAANFTGTRLTPAQGAARCLAFGTPQGQPRIFNFNGGGNFVENVGALDFRPFGSGNFVGGTGSTLRDTGQLAPGLDRYTANLLAHFELSEAFQPFVEAKFVHIDAVQEGQPSFFQSTFPAFFGGGRGIRCDNPFLTADNIAALQAIGRCAGGATSTETLPVGRFNVDFGGRSELIDRRTYRVVSGVRGDFFGDWNYEVSFNYGRVEVMQREQNDLVLFDINGNEAGFLLATDAVRNAQGQIVCRANLTTVTAPGCVPINIFGANRPSQEALDFVQTDSTFVRSRAEQRNALAYINGDLSSLFEFQGGALGFAIGAEYRKETAHEEADPLSASGGTFFNAFQEFDPPALEVKELFGEVQIPLLRNLPLAEELSISAAARYSDYNTAADKTFSWNINGTWAPIRDFRVRANYSKAVRVPTLSDLFQPATQNFAFVQDPCDVLFIGNAPNRAANCAAAGIPVGFVNQPARSQTTEIVSGGNPALEEETGRSLTVGAVFQPRWVPGLSMTVDYYRIRVENLIATLGAQVILNQCFDLPNTNNSFCGAIFPRNPDFTFAQPALVSGGINFAKQQADGIDMEVAYRRTFDNGHRLNFRAVATKVLKRNNFVSPTNPNFSDRQLSELGDPEWAANANVTYGIGRYDLRYSLNYIGKQTIGAYENYFPHQGRPPTNQDFTAEVFYPDALYHAIRLNTKVDDRFNFYMGVDNLFDKAPPLGLLGTAGGDPYESIGRYFYAGATVDF